MLIGMFEIDIGCRNEKRIYPSSYALAQLKIYAVT